MTTEKQVDQAVAQPWTVYDNPEDVRADETLSDAQKRRILDSWELDARELAVAEEENMGGGEPDMLGRVLKARASLPNDEKDERGPATKHGAQPQRSAADHTGNAAPTLSAQEARQGQIVLNTPLRLGIFIGAIVVAALVGAAVLW